MNTLDCIKKLKTYTAIIDNLLQIIQDQALSHSVRKQEAGEELKQLKSSFAKDVKSLDDIKRQHKITFDEDAFLLPALKHANAYLKITTGSSPNQFWVHELYETKREFDYWILELEQRLQKLYKNELELIK